MIPGILRQRSTTYCLALPLRADAWSGRLPHKAVQRRTHITAGHSIPHISRSKSDPVSSVVLRVRAATIMLMRVTAHAKSRLSRQALAQTTGPGAAGRRDSASSRRGSTAGIERVNQIRPTISGVQTDLEPSVAAAGKTVDMLDVREMLRRGQQPWIYTEQRRDRQLSIHQYHFGYRDTVSRLTH